MSIKSFIDFRKHNRNATSVIIKLCCFCFFSTVTPIAIYYNLMQSDFHLTGMQISLNIVVQTLTVVLLTTPVGILADKYSRKRILMIAPFASMFSLVTMIISKTFTSFLIAHILFGLALTLRSSSLEALLYDELYYVKRQNLYQKSTFLTYSSYLLGLAISTIVALPFINNNHTSYDTIMYISIACNAVSLIPLALLKETKNSKQATGTQKNLTSREIFSTTLKTFCKKPTLLVFCIFIAIFSGFTIVYLELWTNVASDSKWPKKTIAIFSTLSLIGSIYILYKIRHIKTTIKRILIIGLLMEVLGLIIAYISMVKFAFIFALPLSLSVLITTENIIVMLARIIIQEETSSKTRTTTISFYNTLLNVSKFTVILLFGATMSALHDDYRLSVFNFIVASAILLGICGAVLIYLLMKQSKNKNESSIPEDILSETT